MGVYKERGRAGWQHPRSIVCAASEDTAKTGDTGGCNAKKREIRDLLGSEEVT